MLSTTLPAFLTKGLLGKNRALCTIFHKRLSRKAGAVIPVMGEKMERDISCDQGPP